MSRLGAVQEDQERETVTKFIETQARMQKEIVYYSPSVIVSMLEKQGHKTNIPYILRRFEELGIHEKNGLYVRELE